MDMCVDVVEKQKRRWDQVRGALTQLARRTDSSEAVRIVDGLVADLGDTLNAESGIVRLSRKVKSLETELTVTKIELANRTKECEMLQRRVNTNAHRYEQLSKNVDTLQREIAIATKERKAAQGSKTQLNTALPDDKGAHAKRARYLSNQLALTMQQLTALERQKKWWMAKSAVLEAETMSLITYHQKAPIALMNDDARSKLIQLVWKVMNENPLENGYSFVNTASQLKSMLGEAFGKKVTKLPQIPPYRQRGATMITTFTANRLPIPKGYMVLSQEQTDFLTMSISCEALDCDRGSLWVVDARQNVMWTYVQNAYGNEFTKLEMELPKRGTDPYAENIGLVASAYLLKQPISIYNAYEDKRFNSSANVIDTKVQVVNKRREPVFDQDDEALLKNIAVLGLEMIMVFEKSAVSGFSMKRQSYLLQFATEIMQYCADPNTLLGLLTLYMNELFRAKKVALHIVVGDMTAQIVHGGAQPKNTHGSPTPTRVIPDQKQLEKNLKPHLGEMTGIVGETVNSKSPLTFSFPAGDELKSAAAKHDPLRGIYDESVDLSPPDNNDLYARRDSQKKRYVLHSYPLFDKRSVTAVLQFVCVDGKKTSFGNDEEFDPYNVSHTKVLKQICNYIVVVMRDWYTSAERKDLHERWAKAARTKSPADIAMAAFILGKYNNNVGGANSEKAVNGGTGVRKSSREEGQKAPSGKAQGGGSLWGLTEGERQSDWKNAEPGWEVRNLSTIYQASFEAGLISAQDLMSMMSSS
ncbi:hypothetical protein Pmar_PMAR002202 [Perkinsus marinus ATCC 50983]|uniref:GAF domain-containing protein n=1 Tax=Perkinsus marinus (strain ATCC 50983 / TXsc) TaxID=423536 RepID=C5L8X5_PERM5|nr:hypothetical protein Pmar_PMAR002202 [Perkinsus marinus ATCC 50983]EER06833.1 hypothetical protein Pmar_PMAR002202 [Perkinsus marinus ATCC 50983]|eukprot:XP_002775017.1 hypothetical protein Pmar_PMAR002202 [Perkinsus marinus ATCC 50983]